MLMHWMTAGAGDVQTMVKRRVMVGGGLLTLGGLALVLWGTLVRNSSLPDVAKGFYLGMGSGVIAGSVVLLLYCLWLWRHPEQAKTEFIKQKDEREMLVNSTAAKWGFYAVYFAMMPALMIAAPLSFTVFKTLFFVLMVMSIVLLVCQALARRKL